MPKSPSQPPRPPTLPSAAHDDRVLTAGRKMIRVRDGDGVREITMIAALVAKLYETAGKGSPMALRDALANHAAAEARDEVRIAAKRDLYTRVKAKHEALIEAALKARLTRPVLYPDPLDILIPAEGEPSIVGPFSAEDAKPHLHSARLRDLLYLQQHMEDGQDDVPWSERPSMGGAMAYAIYINMTLPPSLRHDGVIEVVQAMGAARGHTKKTLPTAVRAGWRALGARVRRGRRLPDRDGMMAVMHGCHDLAAASLATPPDPRAEWRAAERLAETLQRVWPVAGGGASGRGPLGARATADTAAAGRARHGEGPEGAGVTVARDDVDTRASAAAAEGTR